MRVRALGLELALLGASALFAVGCGGAAQPAAVSAANTAGGARAASMSGRGVGVTTVAGVELVAGTRRLKVAGPAVGDGTADAPAPPQIFLSRGRAQGGERSEMEAEPFRVADLPNAAIPEALSAVSAPSSEPSGEAASEIFVDWQSAMRGVPLIGRPEPYTSVRVSLRGQKLARVRIGGSEGTVTQGGGGGVYVVCRVPEDAPRRFVSARWESLSSPSLGEGGSSAPAAVAGAKATSPGSVTLTVTDAWFDMHECKATVVRRTSVEVKALSGGLLFAYREACAKCAPGAQTELVTLLGPMPQTISASGVGGDAVTLLGAVTRVSLPVRKGGGGSVLARYSSGIVRDWLGSLGRTGTPDSDVVVGVDIVQGVGDPEPVAIAYASREAGPSGEAEVPQGSVMDVFGMQSSRPRPTVIKPGASTGLVDPFAVKKRKISQPRANQDRLGF